MTKSGHVWVFFFFFMASNLQICAYPRTIFKKTINVVDVLLSQFDLLSSVMTTLSRVALCN